jgi:hypothetical protein
MMAAQALRHAWRTVRNSKRMLVWVGLVDLLVCLPAAVLYGGAVHAVAGRRADALELAQRFDPDFFADLRSRAPELDTSLAALALASLVVYFLVRPLVMGGFVGAAASGRRMHFAAFAREGGALYWKFLRLSFVAVVACYLLSIGAKPLLDKVAEWAVARSEATAHRYHLVTQVVVFGVFCLLAVVLDYTRVGMKLSRRPGVFREFGRSALFVLHHPGRTLSLFAVTFAAELAVLAGFGWLVRTVDGGYLTTSEIVLVVMQGVVTLREACRLAHVAGAWHIRAADAGEEPRERQVVVPEPPDSDLLRSSLPWNAR